MVCAVDCGIVVNPDTVEAQIQSAIIFGMTAALYGEITLKDGRVEQGNFDDYQMLRINEVPAIEVHIVQSSEPPGGMGGPGPAPPVLLGRKPRSARRGTATRKAPSESTGWGGGGGPPPSGKPEATPRATRRRDTGGNR